MSNKDEVTQTIVETDNNPRGGNCFQAAVASLLQVPLEQVPHFCDKQLPCPERWYATFVEWSAAHGLAAVFLRRDDTGKFSSARTPLATGLRVVALGASPRAQGASHSRHAVLGRTRRAAGSTYMHIDVVWDPHPSRTGLVGEADEIIVLAPLDIAAVYRTSCDLCL